MHALLRFYCIIVVLLWSRTLAVDRSKFRTCESTGFCKRFRPKEGAPLGQSYHILSSSVVTQNANGKLSARLSGPTDSPELDLLVAYYDTGAVRVKVTEDVERWEPEDILQPAGMRPQSFEVLDMGSSRIPSALRGLTVEQCITLGLSGESVLAVHLNPLKFELYQDNELQIVANDRDLMHFEWKQDSDGRALASAHHTEEEEDRHGGKKVVGYWEDGLAIYEDGSREQKVEHVEENSVDIDGGRVGVHGHEDWTERFGAHVDSRPEGPMSVGLDFSFPFAKDVYGIPEHTSPLSLPTTQTGTTGEEPKYSEPYRLYNLDVFEYELDNTMALYGHIPFMMAHGTSKNGGKSITAAIYWHNPSETFIDVSDGGPSAAQSHKQSRWISETGNIDFFLLPGPSVKSVYRQYTSLVGTQQLPPIFSLGYHQCRWNYRDERDVAAVEQTFEDLDFPVDVIWLDIEHTDGKRYFTWDKNVFPNPEEMQKNVSAHGRKMVTIVDPHIKRDNKYWIHSEATQKGLYVKDKNGEDFDGFCWPGQSSYLDFTSRKVRDWWATRFALNQYKGSTLDLFTWNDMNEPSVFNGPEVSMQKDAKNLADIEHRYWHNLYGLYMQRATAEGLTKRTPSTMKHKLRPFVLSRAFWTGSQRYGAIWTGDNTADWGHLKIAAPMLMSINLAGLSFAGADVGGFFGEPGAELMTRWFQAGAFTPFFRGHAHHDTKRREPWVHGDEHTQARKKVAMLRYSLLPLWYTVFYEAYRTGMPVMRPMFMEFPDDAACFKMDDQWMIGSSLLVKPVTSDRERSVSVYLPSGGGPWYDLETLQAVYPSSAAQTVSVSAPLDKIPVFIRSGSIVPRKLRLRRSAALMLHDPLSIYVAPGTNAEAEGELYLDDETTLAHEDTRDRVNYVHRFLRYAHGTLSCVASDPSAVPAYNPANLVERLVLMGQSKSFTSVTLHVDGAEPVPLEFSFDAAAQTVVVKKPNVLVAADWSIKFM